MNGTRFLGFKQRLGVAPLSPMWRALKRQGAYILMTGIGIGAFYGCEDRIELDLHDAAPHIVIMGEITNRQTSHFVSVHRTVPIASDVLSSPVSGAWVRVTDDRGRVFVFNEMTPGSYRSGVFRGVVGMRYTLEVQVDEKTFTATSQMPPPVNIDSLGTSSTTLFGNENIYVTLKFDDPPAVANYYRYLTGVNGAAPVFNAVFSDKFNDGLHVSHELMNFGVGLQVGDSVKIQRQYIDEATFLYWRSITSTHPGSAAPANPPTNLAHGALGYFSAYSVSEYELVIPEKPE